MLPNGTAWTFQYTSDGNGDLQQITFPTGGTIAYQWERGNPYCTSNFYNNIRSVKSRTLNPQDGVTPASIWSYQSAPGQTIVTDPTANDTVHIFNAGVGVTCPVFETSTMTYQGSHTAGTLLKSVSMGYQPIPATPLAATYEQASPTSIGYEQLVSTSTVWPATNQVNKVVYTYDGTVEFYNPVFVFATGAFQYPTPVAGSYGLLTGKQEYDYGIGAPGPLLRTTTTSYEALSNLNYLNNNLLGLPASVVVSGLGPGSTTNYAYDGPNSGNLTTVSRLLNTTGGYLTTTTTFNSDGTPKTVKDPNGDVAHTYSYSYPPPNTYKVCDTNPLAQQTCSTYDFNTGLLLTTTDANGQTTTYTYDEMLRPATITHPPGGGETFFDYNDSVGVSSYTTHQTFSSSGTATLDHMTVFDGLGRVTHKVLGDPAGPDVVDYGYDSMGRVAKVSNPYRTTSDETYGLTTYLYDPLGRVNTTTQPDGSTVQTSYAGSATEVIDEGNGTNPVQRISQTDGLGRMTSVCEVSNTTLSFGTSSAPVACVQPGTTATSFLATAKGFITTYRYDALDNLVGVSQGSENRSFGYDSLSRLTSSANPESGTMTYGYDANSNLTSKVAPAPNQPANSTATVTAIYQYDALNRNTSTTYSDGTPPILSSYDQTGPGISIPHGYAIGRLTARGTYNFSKNTWYTLTEYGYDQMGRVNATGQCGICTLALQTMRYNYDGVSDVTGFTDPGGNTFTYGYNNAAQLLSVTSSLSDATHPATLLSNPMYNSFGDRVSATMGTDVFLNDVHYDNRGRLLEKQIASNANGFTGFEHLYYSYAPNGNLTWFSDGLTGIYTYQYDDFNRLKSSVISPYLQVGPYFGYAYDRYGNRWQQTVGSTSASATCTAGNSVCVNFDVNNHVTGGILTYDAAGNVIADANHTYTYDAENRLTQVDGGKTATYVYDGSGQRVAKTVNGITVQNLYDLSGHVVMEENSAGQENREEIYDGGEHLVTYRNGDTYFAAADQLGTERVRSTQDVSSYDNCINLPFGDDLSCFGPADGDISPLHFTGQERDPESGNDNFKARFYSSNFGRFMSPDPIMSSAHDDDPQTWNKYGYARNNPLRYSDPTGLDFSLSCEQNNGTTCQGGSIYFKDANGKYEETLIQSDAYGNLSDQTGNSYIAIVSGSGVTFSGNGSSNVAGTFVNGMAATIINGSGALSGFTFKFTYSDTKSGVSAGGTFSYNGAPDQTESALQTAGFTHYFGDNFDRFHPSTKDYRAADYRSAGAAGTGAGSGHFTVHEPWVLVDNQVFIFKPSSPTLGTLHLGESNPYTGGLVDHARQVINHELGTDF